MSAATPPTGHGRPFRTLRGGGGSTTPDLRSPVVRRLLTFASVTALTVLVGVVTEVLTGTLSDSPLGQTLVPLMDRFGWLAVPVLVLFVAAPVAAAIRERSLGVDPAILSGEFVGPGPLVGLAAGDARSEPPAPLDEAETRARFGRLDLGEQLLLRALATLPDVTLSADAILAVNDAVRSGFKVVLARSRHDLPLTASPAKQLERLVENGLLIRPATAQYRVHPSELDLALGPSLTLPSEAAAGEQAAKDACRLALPAALAHYADLGARWASALGSEEHAQNASRWFRSEAPTLHALVVSCEPHKTQKQATIDEFAKLGDALDVWYTREWDPGEALKVARVLQAHAEAAGRPTLRDLAQARAAAAQRATGEAAAGVASTSSKRRLPKLRGRDSPLFRPPGVRARELHEQAMVALDAWRKSPETEDLVSIEHRLTDAWFTLPRADVAGEVTTLINLAVVYLHQGRFEAAEDRLELADHLTRDGRDAGGRAHALELHGVTTWALGRPRRAVTYWKAARDLYDRLGEQTGLARCLQHLGSAVVLEASLGGLVVDPPKDGQLNQRLVWTAAMQWLDRSQELRKGRPSELAKEYLKQVENKLKAETAEAGENPIAVEGPERTERAEGSRDQGIMDMLKRIWRRFLGWSP